MRHKTLLFATLAALAGCHEIEIDLDVRASEATLLATRSGEPIAPIEPMSGIDAELAHVGGLLFHDPGLSADGTVSCASCHAIPDGGDDGLAFSVGVGGQVGGINAPTVLNAALHVAQFWDGRATTLEQQALGPVTAAVEMAADWDDVVAYVRTQPQYNTLLTERFGDVSPDAVAAAIAEFERTLVTPNGPFDQWLLGDDTAISDDALQGYALFKDLGCASCHQGRAVGGNMYQRFGLFGNYLEDQDRPLTAADDGRFAVTGDEQDRHVFKVPSLRNVALTAPYFHDASAPTLAEAVRIMGRYQLGRELGDTEIQRLVAFLESLTGEIPNVEVYQ